MFRHGQLATHAVEVHDALRGVVVAQDLGVELAQPVRFTLGELVPGRQNSDFVKEFVVRFLIPLSVCKFHRLPGLRTHISASRRARGEAAENNNYWSISVRSSSSATLDCCGLVVSLLAVSFSF